MIWRINSFAVLLLLMLASSGKALDEQRRSLEQDAYGNSFFLMEYDPEEPIERPLVSPMRDKSETRMGRMGGLLSSSFETEPPETEVETEMDTTEEDPDIEDGSRNREADRRTQSPGDVVADDDYSVVVLADDVPWDLTEDTVELPTDKMDAPGPTLAPTVKVVTVADDDDDYVYIILEDDVPWDDTAVAEYIKDEFEAINNANTNSSDYDDDDFTEDPTPVPTISVSPSSVPTITAIPTRSANPTASHNPTTDSHSPSGYPSSLPTLSPSQVPSTSPTIFCHDHENYRSPINNLTCSLHANTNCLKWMHLGLNLTELEMLVNSCPETCNIECGTFDLFSAPVSFTFSRVSGFMDPEDVAELMEFSTEYLEKYVRNFISKIMNEIKEAKEKEEEEKAKKLSESNDNELVSRMENSENDDDDFLNDDMVNGGGGISFEIDAAVLTAQNLVEDIFESTDTLETQGDGINGVDINGVSRRERLLRRRSLQDLQRTKQQSSGGESIVKTDEALDIIITFNGYAIGMNSERMSELLVLGIDSVDFTSELQQSGIEFFSEATVSSAALEIEEEDDFLVEEEIEEEEDEGNSTFSVVISYLVPIVVVGFALGSLFYHKCYVKGKWVPSTFNHRRDVIERAQIGGMTATPMEGSIANSLVAENTSNSMAADSSNDEGSPGRYFNFRGIGSTSFNSVEENGTGRMKATDQADTDENGNKEDSGSAFARLFRGLNLNLTLTKSKNSTDEEDDDEEVEEVSFVENGDAREESGQGEILPVAPHDLVSPMSGDSEKSDDPQFKAYASVLPPMIVIDNIDGTDAAPRSSVMTATDSTANNSNGIADSARSSNTPIEDLDAVASEFRKKLQRNSSRASKSQHQSFAGNYISMYSSSALDANSDRGPLFGSSPSLNAKNNDLLIQNMVSDEWDGDDLFSPLPSNITTNDDEDVNDDDLLPHPESTSSSSAGDDDDSSTTSPITTLTEKERKKDMYGSWDTMPSPSSTGQDLETKLSSSSIPATVQHASLPKSRTALPPKRPPTPDRASSNLRKNGNGSNVVEQQNRRPSFPKFAPIARAFIGTSSGSSLGSIVSEKHKRQSSSDTAPELPKNNSSMSALSSEELVIENSKSDGSNFNSSNRLEFEAPREGNWGLVLESSSKTGPRIYAVKDYSPLFGLVQKGDKLLEVDGKNVAKSNLTDVTKLLKGKHYHRSTSTTMPIVVSRSPIPNIHSSAYAGSHNASYGSNDLQHQHPGYSDPNHKRNNSFGSFGSNGSSGSRVVEDVDDDSNNNNNNNNNAVYHQDQHQNNQGSHAQWNAVDSSFEYDNSNQINAINSSFEYDSSNEI